MKQETKIVVKSLVVAAGATLAVVGGHVRKLIDTSDGVSVSGLQPNLVASRDDTPNVSASDTFYQVSRLLKEEYVEPVNDDMKLSSGAVRGMVASLGDPESLFMDKEEFRIYRNAKQGSYEGIGAALSLITTAKSQALQASLQPTGESSPEEALATTPKIPKLTVSTVVPGSPADRAGMKVGDVIDSVDGHWVVNSDLIEEFNLARKKFADHKMSVAEINELRKKLRAQTERALLPLKAKRKLVSGTGATVQVAWIRGGKRSEATITTAASQIPTFRESGGTISLEFAPGVATKLKSAITGMSAVTFDLRNNPDGDFAEMKRCLALVARSGQYGWIRTQRAEKSAPLTVTSGAERPPKLRLIVDKSTRGAAEIFALALAKYGGAKLEGAATGGERSVVETVALPDGSGYSLVTGEYSVAKGGTK